jgi:hypothetical protein
MTPTRYRELSLPLPFPVTFSIPQPRAIGAEADQSAFGLLNSIAKPPPEQSMRFEASSPTNLPAGLSIVNIRQGLSKRPSQLCDLLYIWLLTYGARAQLSN